MFLSVLMRHTLSFDIMLCLQNRPVNRLYYLIVEIYCKRHLSLLQYNYKKLNAVFQKHKKVDGNFFITKYFYIKDIIVSFSFTSEKIIWRKQSAVNLSKWIINLQ